MQYCNHCAEAHSKRAPCPAIRKTKTMSTRSSTVAAKLATQGSSHEEMDELTSSFTTLSFEEPEKRTKQTIEEVEADIRLAELEECLERLQDHRDQLRKGTQVTSSRQEVERGSHTWPAAASIQERIMRTL